MKRAVSAEPLIDDDAQCILIAGWTGLTVDLLRRHVGYRASHILRALVARTLGDERDTEVAEQDLAASSHEHVLRFDIAVNELLIVGILQSLSNLLDVGDDQLEGEGCSRSMTSATRRAVHTSPRKPYACAPLVSNWEICAFCSVVSRGIIPSGGCALRASTPPLRPRLNH